MVNSPDVDTALTDIAKCPLDTENHGEPHGTEDATIGDGGVVSGSVRRRVTRASIRLCVSRPKCNSLTEVWLRNAKVHSP